MSTNRLNFDTSNKLIQEHRNCVNVDGSKKLNLNYKGNVFDDKCFIDVQTRQALGPGTYSTNNHYDCEALIPNTVNNATDNVTMTFKNGHDVGSAVIDDATKLRVGKTRKFPKCPNQLFARPYLTVPYMGRGPGNMVLESQLTPGEDTSSGRACNTLSGVTIPHYFTPLVPHLDHNIQNPEHIVQETVDEGWVRGGNPSRLIVRDIDYLERCGYDYMDKETNTEFWKNEHMFL